MRKLTIILAFFVVIVQLQAQSWSKTYGNNYTSLGQAAVPTADGGFAIVGYGEGIGGGKSQLQLLKVDVNGKELWIQGFGGQDVDLGFDIANTFDKGFILAGSSYIDATKLRQFFLVKTNEKGEEIWSKTFGASDVNDIGYSVLAASNGDFLVAGSTQEPATNNVDAALHNLDANGNLLWSVPFGGAGIQEFKKVIEVADGYVCVGRTVVGKNASGGDNNDALIVKVSKTGQVLWSKTYGSMAYEDAQSIVALANGGFVICGKDTSDIIITRTDKDGIPLWTKKYGSTNEDEGFSIIQTKDGNLVFAGNSATDNSNVDGFAMKINIDGTTLWTRRVGSSQRYETFNHVVEAKDGSLFFTGVWGSNVFLITSKTYAVKTETEGILGNNYVQGKVFYDKNNNCKFDKDDTALNDWLIQITKPTRSYLGLSNAQGEVFSTVDSGNYNVKLLPQNSYWKQVCQTSYNISLAEQEDTVSVEFALRPAVNCAAMEVNISTPQLLRCQDNRYVVNFCNRGTTVATNSYIDIVFDEFFDDFKVNLASWSNTNNTIRCNIGDVQPGTCGQFDIITTLDKACNSTVLGQSHQVLAHIYPDVICTTPNTNWDGSSIEVTGSCVNDRVQFKVKNAGANNQIQGRNAIIIEDDVVYRAQPIKPLNVNEEIIITAPDLAVPPTGKTYRIVVEQSIGHPGKSNPTIAIEGCANGSFSTGYVLQFSEDDGDSFVSVSTQESKGKNNSNEKVAFPKGYRAQRFITDTTELDYQIFFNNTYGDTLRSLTILDTLSQFLNPLSIKEIQSSHKYQLTFPQANILQFTFNDIKLPDSSANALLSSGFVKFRLSQKLNTPSASLIHNRAALFYGNKASVLTNKVTHTVGKNFIIVGTINPIFAKVKLNVGPNPFNDVTSLDISGLNEEETKAFQLFDAQGRSLRKQQFIGNSLQIERNDLPQGLYLFQLSQKGVIIGSGKIVIH